MGDYFGKEKGDEPFMKFEDVFDDDEGMLKLDDDSGGDFFNL